MQVNLSHTTRNLDFLIFMPGDEVILNSNRVPHLNRSLDQERDHNKDIDASDI